jgi:putative ABC transport system permease protein
VIFMLLRQSLARALAGVLAGAAVALIAARSMASLLFRVHAADPASLVTVAAVLLGVAAAATLIPAVQAIRLSPVAALRADS